MRSHVFPSASHSDEEAFHLKLFGRPSSLSIVTQVHIPVWLADLRLNLINISPGQRAVRSKKRYFLCLSGRFLIETANHEPHLPGEIGQAVVQCIVVPPCN